MRRCIDRQTFDELLVVNAEEAERSILCEESLLETVRPFIPDAALYFRVSHDETTFENRMESAYVGVIRNGVQLFIRYDSYRKEYLLFFDREAFRHSDYRTVEWAKEGLQQPNRMKKLSTRKVEEWITFLVSHYRNLERLDAENRRKIASFRERIEAIPDVIWNVDRNGGRIRRHGLTYTFCIERTEYKETISLDYSVAKTLDHFLALSDNKYVPDC